MNSLNSNLGNKNNLNLTNSNNSNNSSNNSNSFLGELDNMSMIILVASVFVLIVFVILILSIYYKTYSQNQLKDHTETEILPYIHDCRNNPKMIYGTKIPSSTLGNEYSLNFWIYINSLDYRYSANKHIITKGKNGSLDPIEGVYKQANPSIYLEKKTNTLKFNFDLTGSDPDGTDSLGCYNVLDVLQGNIKINNIHVLLNKHPALIKDKLELVVPGKILSNLASYNFAGGAGTFNNKNLKTLLSDNDNFIEEITLDNIINVLDTDDKKLFKELGDKEEFLLEKDPNQDKIVSNKNKFYISHKNDSGKKYLGNLSIRSVRFKKSEDQSLISHAITGNSKIFLRNEPTSKDYTDSEDLFELEYDKILDCYYLFYTSSGTKHYLSVQYTGAEREAGNNDDKTTILGKINNNGKGVGRFIFLSDDKKENNMKFLLYYLSLKTNFTEDIKGGKPLNALTRTREYTLYKVPLKIDIKPTEGQFEYVFDKNNQNNQNLTIEQCRDIVKAANEDDDKNYRYIGMYGNKASETSGNTSNYCYTREYRTPEADIFTAIEKGKLSKVSNDKCKQDNTGNGKSIELGNSNHMFIHKVNSTPSSEKIEIKNIPLQRWVSINLQVHNNIIDIFMDGLLYKTHIIQKGFPKQNNDNITIGNNGGFDGYLSNVIWANKALHPGDIYSIYKRGPRISLTIMDRIKKTLGFLPDEVKKNLERE